MFQSSHSPGTFTIKAAILGFRLGKDSPQTNLNFAIPICFGRSTAMSLVALEHQPWHFLEEGPGHWISFHPQRGVQPKVKAKDWHKPSSQDCYVPRSTGTKKVWPSLFSHLIPCDYRHGSGQRGLWLFRHICSQDVGSTTLRWCCPFPAECFLWYLCLSVCLVQTLSVLGLRLFHSPCLSASVRWFLSMCVCARVHVYMYPPVSPSKCVSFLLSFCLPLFQSACSSCLFLPLSCLCLPLRQSVCARPSMTITIVQSTRAALWLSWAQHFCLHGLLHVWKKNYNTFYDCIGIEANIIQDVLITVHSLLLYLAFLLIKKI